MVNLSPDLTFPLMWLIFMGVLGGVTLLVFRPTLSLLEARENRTRGLKSKAQVLTEEVQKKIASYEEALHQAKLKAGRERETMIVGAREEEQKILAEARQEIDAGFAELQSRLIEEKRNAVTILTREASFLARDMVQKILEREVV